MNIVTPLCMFFLVRLLPGGVTHPIVAFIPQ
jgi:hypothetical protein